MDDRSGRNNDTNEAVPENDTNQPSLTSEEIVVENTSVDRIIESIYLSQIVADITVRNTADKECQSLELRVDAYYNPPEDNRTYHPSRTDERTAVGYRYVDREFDNFGSGTRTFEDVIIQYDADADANDSVNPDTFDLSVAIRNIEQS